MAVQQNDINTNFLIEVSLESDNGNFISKKISITELIKNIADNFNYLSSKTFTALESTNASLLDTIEDLSIKLTTKIDTTKNNLTNQLKNVSCDLTSRINTTKNNLTSQLKNVSCDLTSRINAANISIDNAFKDIDYLSGKIDDLFKYALLKNDDFEQTITGPCIFSKTINGTITKAQNSDYAGHASSASIAYKATWA